jgi:hypothetical protein
LCEQGFIRFDSEAWYKRVTGEKEKSTQDPGETRDSYRGIVRLHSRERMNRNSDGTRCGFGAPERVRGRFQTQRFGLAPKLLSIGLVQASLGQNIEGRFEWRKKALKPFAQFSVYISAEAKSPKENK